MAMTLKAARVNAGLTQQEIADKIAVNVNTYRRWEQNPGEMPVKKAVQLCNLVKLSSDDIFFAN